MRLPNQAKPVVRHASQVEAGVTPSFLGGFGDVLEGVVGNIPIVSDVYNCAKAMASCGSDYSCYLKNAPSCITAAISAGALLL